MVSHRVPHVLPWGQEMPYDATKRVTDRTKGIAEWFSGEGGGCAAAKEAVRHQGEPQHCCLARPTGTGCGSQTHNERQNRCCACLSARLRCRSVAGAGWPIPSARHRCSIATGTAVVRRTLCAFDSALSALTDALERHGRKC